MVISCGSIYSSSHALSGLVRNNPGLLSKEKVLKYIRQLMFAGNGHHAYLRLIVDETLVLEHNERLELLPIAARVAPLNNRLWSVVWLWIQRHYNKKEQRIGILEQLFNAGCQSSSILIHLMQYLPLEKSHIMARRLLTESTDPQVLSTCLNLLGKEAKTDAKRLLTESTDPQVLCTCLNLLGQEAKQFSIERIRNWTETDPSLLVRCFQVVEATKEVQKVTEEMLVAWDKLPSNLRNVALRAPFDTPLRIQYANEVLSNLHRQYRPLVTAALITFLNNPDAVTGYCRTILNRWQSEIVYRLKHHQPEYDGHIIKALSHPALRKEAYKAAQDMLNYESSSPRFLSAELHRQVENIIQGQWPLWKWSAVRTSGAEPVQMTEQEMIEGLTGAGFVVRKKDQK